MPVMCSWSRRAAISSFNCTGSREVSLRPTASRRRTPNNCSMRVFQDSTMPSKSTASTPTLRDSTMFSLKSLRRAISRAFLERRIQLGVVERDGNVTCNGFYQLDVVAREEIPVDCFAEAQNGNGVLANAARNEIIQVQLLERPAHRVADLFRPTGRLKKERPTGEFGPDRIEEAKIHGFREPHAHRASQAHLAKLLGIVDENRQPVDQQGLRNAVHHRTQHGVLPYFVRQRAAKFDQGAAIVEPVAIEKTIQARLNPLAERLEQKRRNDDGDHPANRPGGGRVEEISTQRHE